MYIPTHPVHTLSARFFFPTLYKCTYTVPTYTYSQYLLQKYTFSVRWILNQIIGPQQRIHIYIRNQSRIQSSMYDHAFTIRIRIRIGQNK